MLWEVRPVRAVGLWGCGVVGLWGYGAGVGREDPQVGAVGLWGVYGVIGLWEGAVGGAMGSMG